MSPLEIYTQLLIATLSFIAPVMVGLLTVSPFGLDRLSYLAKENELRIVDRVFGSELNRDAISRERIRQADIALSRDARFWQKQMNGLDPKSQAVQLFSALFISLMSLMIFSSLSEADFTLRLSTIAISLLGFFRSILLLKRIFWTVMDLKKMIHEEQTKTREAKNNSTINF